MANNIFKWLILTILVANAIDTLGQQSPYPALDEARGINTIQVGDSINKLSNKRSIGFYRKKQRYVLNPEPLLTTHPLDGIRLNSVYYDVYKDRIHSIIIHAEGKENVQALLTYLMIFYGEGVKQNMGNNYRWEAKFVTLTYEQNLLTSDTQVIFISKEIDNLFQKDWKEVSNE